MDRKKQEAIAVFRYGIIAPVIHAAGKGQAKYFRRLAQKELEVPFLGPRRYTQSTFKSWLRRYRREGFQGLLPRCRSDAGQSRVITGELSRLMGEILAEHPQMPVVHLRERLVALGQITSRRISENTLRRHIARAGLRPARTEPPKARKRFEKPQANQMWTLDFMHGPRVSIEGRRGAAKTYLAAAIDDHSRFITAASFYPRENSPVLASLLKEAFSRHGLPQILYCDNASAFSGSHLTLACARLGVALVHSRPYDSPSRGKIERFFRSLRSGFLALLPAQTLTLADLNARLHQWLDQRYHRRLHAGIGERPLDRYMRSLAQLQPRFPTREELDQVFYRTLSRKVTKDGLVSIAGVRWELPAAYVGQRVEIRHPQGRPQELYLFEEDKPVCRLHRLDLAENASRPRPIRFSLQSEEQDS
ncbi:DDE-type integrase/transposase/recombinase [Acidobacteria bacterium AH-259-G07]|nr:DDE-type integrase/transposase/recombinase [Acidobacteria bacterium AH-259-G07]